MWMVLFLSPRQPGTRGLSPGGGAQLLPAKLLGSYRRGGCYKEETQPPPVFLGAQTTRVSAWWVPMVFPADSRPLVHRPHGQNYLLPLSGWEMGVQRSTGFPLSVGQATVLTLPAQISGHTSPQGTYRVTAPRKSDRLSVSQASSCLCSPAVSVMSDSLLPHGP